MTPINTLPDELLISMFELVVHKNQRSLICVLPCVCKRWKEIIFNMRKVEVRSYRLRPEPHRTLAWKAGPPTTSRRTSICDETNLALARGSRRVEITLQLNRPPPLSLLTKATLPLRRRLGFWIHTARFRLRGTCGGEGYVRVPSFPCYYCCFFSWHSFFFSFSFLLSFRLISTHSFEYCWTAVRHPCRTSASRTRLCGPACSSVSSIYRCVMLSVPVSTAGLHIPAAAGSTAATTRATHPHSV